MTGGQVFTGSDCTGVGYLSAHTLNLGGGFIPAGITQGDAVWIVESDAPIETFMGLSQWTNISQSNPDGCINYDQPIEFPNGSNEWKLAFQTSLDIGRDFVQPFRLIIPGLFE